MMNYKTLSTQPRPFLAMTGLTPAEFRDLLPAFETAYEQVYPTDRTAAGRPRQRWPGVGGTVPFQAARTNCCSSWST